MAITIPTVNNVHDNQPEQELTSINNILRANPGKRLFTTRPLAWTQDHLTLLGRCSFVVATPDVPPLDPYTQQQRQWSGDQSNHEVYEDRDEGREHDEAVVLIHAQQLATTRSCQLRESSIIHLLTRGPDRRGDLTALNYDDGITFFFNDKPINRLSCTGIVLGHRYISTLLPSSGLQDRQWPYPVLAHIHLDTVQEARLRCLPYPPLHPDPSLLNEPCLRLRQLRMQSIQPKDPLDDPYIVALLITLAQSQSRTIAILQAADDTTAQYRTVSVLAFSSQSTQPN